MQSSYAINPFHHAINRTLSHIGKSFPMTQRQSRPESTEINWGAAGSPGVAIEDWDMLFTAVKVRLALLAQTQTQNPIATAPLSAEALQLERLCASVLECVAALDQLHATALDALVEAGG